MAQSGFTPISLYYSTTASAVPVNTNLVNGELAINITDGKLYYKNNAGVVTLFGSSSDVSTISFGTTGLTPNTATGGAITVAGTLITSNGGTGLSSWTAGDLPYYASGTALSKLGIGTNGQILTSTGTAPQWSTLSGVAVTTFSAGTTGFTPSTATSGAITLAGTLATTNGGTGLTSFTANQVFYASSTSAIGQSANLTFNGTTLTANTIGAFTLGGTISGGGNQINNIIIGASTPLAGSFTTLSASGATTFTAGTASTSTTTGTAVITGGLGVSGRINAANFDGIIGANTAAAGNFTTLGATGVATFSAGTVSLPAITTTGDTNTGIFFPAADTIAFTEGGVEAMRIDSSGQVGIGTSSPAYKFVVNGSSSDERVYFQNTNAAGSQYFIVSAATGRSITTFVPGSSTAFSNQFANPLIESATVLNLSGITDMRMFTQNTERMRIDSSGRVGIGETTPGNTLSIKAPVATTLLTSSTGTNTVYTQYTNTGGSFYVGRDNSTGGTFGATYGSYLYSEGAYPLVTWINGSERMRIDSSGNVGIGTSSPVASSLLTLKKTNAGGDGAELRLINSSTTVESATQIVFTNTTTDSGNSAVIKVARTSAGQDFRFSSDGSERMRITSTGNLLIGTTASQARLTVVGGSIAPQAVPSSFWGIDYAASGAGNPPNYITFTASATYDLASGSGLVILHNNSNGDASVFITYGGNVVKLGGAASVVAGVGGLNQIGLAYNSGTGSYRINNGYVTSQDIFITTIRTRTSS